MESGLEGGGDSDNENANTDIHTPPRGCTDLVVIGTDPRAEHGLLRGYDLLPLLQFLLYRLGLLGFFLQLDAELLPLARLRLKPLLGRLQADAEAVLECSRYSTVSWASRKSLIRAGSTGL